MTIEDPIEYLHPTRWRRIDQREVGLTRNVQQRHAGGLRQDPDVILVGEMRDPETVFAPGAPWRQRTLGALDPAHHHATETVNRMIDFFPPHQHNQIRVDVWPALKGTIGQRLVRRADGNGRVAGSR